MDGTALGKYIYFMLLIYFNRLVSLFLAAGSDYNTTMETLVFNVSTPYITVHVRLVNDNRYEFEEFLRGVLSTLDPAVIVNPSEATTFIEDEDTGMLKP